MAADDPGRLARTDFEAHVRGEVRPLLRLAVSILRDGHEAEDAVQDSLELAWRSWSSLRDRDRIDAWLRRICVRRCLAIRRHLFRRLFLSEGDVRATPTSEIDAVDPDLDRVLRRLPVRQRAVVALHYGHGYAIDECAALMGCRPGTAHSHLARALSTLRKELEP